MKNKYSTTHQPFQGPARARGVEVRLRLWIPILGRVEDASNPEGPRVYRRKRKIMGWGLASRVRACVRACVRAR